MSVERELAAWKTRSGCGLRYAAPALGLSQDKPVRHPTWRRWRSVSSWLAGGLQGWVLFLAHLLAGVAERAQEPTGSGGAVMTPTCHLSACAEIQRLFLSFRPALFVVGSAWTPRERCDSNLLAGPCLPSPPPRALGFFILQIWQHLEASRVSHRPPPAAHY